MFFFFAQIVLSEELRFVQVKPLRSDTIGGILGDIDCRMQGWGKPWTIYRNDDKVTWGHEGTHSVNARIKIDNKIANGFYLLNGQGVILSNPNISLRDVANAIPEDKRNSTLYQLYMVDAQKYWNEKPLYCIDELIAYLNGTVVGIEFQMSARTLESYNKTLIMYDYAKIAQILAKKSNYKDQLQLDALLEEIERKIEILTILLKQEKLGRIK